MTKDYKISPNLNFERNSPASIQKKSDLEMLDNVLLALNDDQSEINYSPRHCNSKNAELTL